MLCQSISFTIYIFIYLIQLEKYSKWSEALSKVSAKNKWLAPAELNNLIQLLATNLLPGQKWL